MRTATTIALAAVAGVAAAQTSRIAWTRASTSADVIQDTVRAGAFLPNGNFVVVGGSKQPDGTTKGCMTIFNRNRAVVKVKEFARPGGGSMEFRHVVVTANKIIAVGANGPGNIEVENDETHTVGTDHLMEDEGIFYFSVAPGKEEVTDIAVDPNGALVMAGYRMDGSSRRAFLCRQATPGISSVTNLGLNAAIMTGMRPEMTINGIIAILIGFTDSTGKPTLNSYTPGGTLNWSLGASNPTSAMPEGYKLENVLITGYAYASTSWTREITPGVFESGGRIHKFDINTGTEVATVDTPTQSGASKVRSRGMASGMSSGKRVNALFDFGNKGRIFSYDVNLNPTFSWTSPMTCQFTSDLKIDQYDELIAALCNNENIPEVMSYGAKLNPGNQTRFSWGMDWPYGFSLPDMVMKNIVHEASGDILTMRSDNNTMQLVKVEQAPVGLSDTYQPKSGKFFRPLLPVTTNDRFAGGATLSIAQQPSHGTLTMGANGIFNYKSTAGYVGTDTFKYRLTKTGLNPSTVTVNLLVRP